MILVYRYRVKSLNGLLNKQSRAVNYVWNFCNDTQKHALKCSKKWPTGFDLNVLTTGSSKELGIHSGTVNATCEQYAKSRSQRRRPYLRYRGRKSLGWVPLKSRDLKREGDALRFAGNTFRVFHSRPLPEGKIKDGTNFAQDARGNWFLNIVIEIARTRMAKSVYDASWSSFRNKLRYKAMAHGATFAEVDESGSTQSCSACGSTDSTTRPQGIAGLRIREWACSGCGVVHDRDINAALNILRCGRASPGVGILRL
ncbi:RNA-guided endonuclease InsQ/TnpB family protein [Burkholderia ambifaria]|uniref:RNA-guided endonuclease InsQ/TnpB family protein n=1 Tax=Burkholderia ambifaria TaxID=152480 RepID=UPI00158A8A67|nr:zinc ribbon domain-containing protein [Burkholderia ambifaria]